MTTLLHSVELTIFIILLILVAWHWLNTF